MAESNEDWRLQGQDQYLHGAVLEWTRWTRPRPDWDHDHCTFCWAKFMDTDDPTVFHDGYATLDRKHWICRNCYVDFNETFAWQVSRER
jgi:hypothetical protein